MAQVNLIPGIKKLLADKGKDTDAFRAFKSVKSVREKRIRRDKRACNVVERWFGRLKDFRRIATRYDKLRRKLFSTLRLVAIVAYWLRIN